ncbi:MAG: MSMEG_1061 family FMN-dependent PPOX-type flavoprotein [Alphaproteobacteria bacterium]
MSGNDLITSEAELRAVYGETKKLAAAAKTDRLDELCRRFIALSPFVCIGSCDADGRQDVSPRGDRPGFVRVLDERTLAIPDRPGNNKLETLCNILVNPQVAILFVIPGHDETLRIFGRARISRDPNLLAPAAVDGKQPNSVILVEIDQIYPHCGKAFRRARMWDAAARPDRQSVPSLAAIALTMAGIKDRKVEDVEAQVQKSYVTDLY